MNIVLFDCNGVLTKPYNESQYHHDLMTMIQNQLDVEKCYNLLKFIQDNEFKFASVSSHQGSVCVVSEMIRALTFNGTEEQKKFADAFYFDYFLDGNIWLKSEHSKEDMEEEVLEKYSDAKIVVFEDEYKFDSRIKQIWTESNTGLTEEHLNQALDFFKGAR